MTQLNFSFKAFEQLTPHELWEIYRARSEVFVVEQSIKYVDIDSYDLNAWHLMAYQEDELVAYLRVIEAGKKAEGLSIGRVLTRKPFRAKGYGKALMQRCVHVCQERFPQKPMEMSAQRYLESFYKGFGFETCSEPFIEEGIEHVYMKKTDTTKL